MALSAQGGSRIPSAPDQRNDYQQYGSFRTPRVSKRRARLVWAGRHNPPLCSVVGVTWSRSTKVPLLMRKVIEKGRAFLSPREDKIYGDTP